VKIDLTELLQKVGNEADIERAETVSFPEDGLKLTQPLKIEAHLVNTGSSVLLTGEAETLAELECSRCLKNYQLPISIEFQEEFSHEPFSPPGKGEIELHPEDFVSPIGEDNMIDLTELIRQEMLLSLPIKTLCNEDCKGIKGEE